MNMSKKNLKKNRESKKVVHEFTTVATTAKSSVIKVKRYLYSMIKDKNEIKQWLNQLIKQFPNDVNSKYAVSVRFTNYKIISMQIIQYRPIEVINIKKPSSTSITSTELLKLLSNPQFAKEFSELAKKYLK